MDREEPREKYSSKGSNKGKGKQKDPFLPKIIPTIAPRFDVNDEEGLNYLEQNGYVVFKDIANQEELEKGRGLAWDFIEATAPGVKRDDKTTWNSPQWPNPFGNGIVCGDGVGHSAFLWYVRGLEKVQQVYAKVWGTDKLITSFDGFCIHRAWEYDENWRTKEGGWYHLDQNGHNKPDKLCVQGFLNFYPAGEEDGGLVVVPKSHTIFNRIFELRPRLKDRGDFIPLFSDKTLWQVELKEARLFPIKVCCQPGDFVLWDSRTIHCNAPGTARRDLPEDGSLLPPRRLVAYVCMTPASRMKHKQLGARVEAFYQGLTTSHWPEECVTLNARKNSKHYVPPVLTDNQKKLIPM